MSSQNQSSFPIATAVSAMRLEKPHSLSYHAITRTSVPFCTLVWSMWKVAECGSWLKSIETLGKMVKPRMPLSCCSAARFIASLISSLVVLRVATILRSITETFGVGTRIDAVELAHQFRQHQADRLGRTGRGRDHRHRRRPAA